MKKYILLFTLIVALSLTGCGAANDNVVHRDGNLIVTNYSDYEITDTTITHLGKTISVSPKAIKDTQICYFTIDPADDYVYTVSFVDNESVEANVKGTDSTKDLAVVAVKISDVKDSTMDEIAVATMGDSSKLEVGEQVIAIGNALGYGQSVTSGIVSATERTLDGYEGGTLIQTDAAINPGNSGGALLNSNGEVIGINTAKVATDSVEGMGYAIPISDASDTIQNLMNQETKTKVSEAEQGYLGIQGVDVSDESAKMYNMPTGVYISDVVKNGGAQQAGLTKGSVITGLEGTTISDMNSLKEQLQYYRVGDKVKVTVQVPGNNGEYTEKTVEVTLGSKS